MKKEIILTQCSPLVNAILSFPKRRELREYEVVRVLRVGKGTGRGEIQARSDGCVETR